MALTTSLEKALRKQVTRWFRLRRWPIFPSVLATLVVLLGVALASWMSLTWLLADEWPAWDQEREPPSQEDTIKLALSVVAGTGGAVALVVAYRRQRVLETDAQGERDQVRLLTERFGAAASQLGGESAAVRLAGVYSMASLADE